MRRRDRTRGKAAKTQRRKALERRNAPKVARRRKPSAADATETIALLTRERDEALQQQTATADVLKVMSRSTFDLPKVLNTLVESAARLCEADKARILRPTGKEASYYVAALYGSTTPEYDEHVRTLTFLPGRGSVVGRVLLEGKSVQIPDVLADPEYTLRKSARLGDYRTVLVVPLLREGSPIGLLVLQRATVRPFTDKQIELATAFADQAVIAIENTRLLSELRESLQQQTATADVLKVISRSTFNLQTVLDTLVESAVRLCEADSGILRTREGEIYPVAATYSLTEQQRDRFTRCSTQPDRGSLFGRAILEGRTIHVPDVLADPEYDRSRLRDLVTVRAGLAVPMMREGTVIGVITLQRRDPRPFSDKQIQLVTTFADQAVIAIENVRLFNETQEALEQQTATSEVLSVISSSVTDAQPVFDMIAESAARLCEAQFCFVYRFDGELLHFVAHRSLTPEVLEINRAAYPAPPTRNSVASRAILERRIVQIPDVSADPEYGLAEMAAIAGYRSAVAVPILRDGVPVGCIAVTRAQVGLLPDRQIDLLKTFADQAVIAIENTRLFEAEQHRTAELSEALEQQTATSEVLKVISSSPGELEPVFNAMLENAVQICGANFGNLWLREGKAFRIGAMYGAPPAFVDYLRTEQLSQGNPGMEQLVRTKEPYQLADLSAVPTHGEKLREATIKLAGARTVVGLPMLKDNEVIGAIVIYRQEVRPFTDKQIELLKNFAAQAVIAIENTRLLKELRQRTDDLSESLEQQTATSEVLKVISSSPGELEPVFTAMLENAVRICEAKFGVLHRYHGSEFYPATWVGVPPAYEKNLRQRGSFRPEVGVPLDRLLQTKELVHTADELAEPNPGPAAKFGGARSLIAVPMFKDNDLVGAIVIYRQEVRPFSDRQIELVKNFAAQAVIAIENTRLLNELRESLQQQTATSDVLRVISSSLNDLKPVFETIGQRAEKLCDAEISVISMVDGDKIRLVSINGVTEKGVEAVRRRYPLPRDAETVSARTIRSGAICHVPDVLADALYQSKDVARVSGYRGCLGVPMIRDGQVIGAIFVARREPGLFADKQVQLLKTFADQAVIAIENVRLFNETKESLAQQTATADVLKVISRSTFDLNTVLHALLETAIRLCDADHGNLARERDGVYQRVATYGYSDDFTEYLKSRRVSPDRGTATGRSLIEGKVVQIPDVRADPDYTGQKLAEFRTVLSVPMLREGIPIGYLALTRREVRPFTDKQIELVSTFADQAAIAIENVRLFESVEARTRELAASLENLRSTQDRLVQTQKLASLGQLTAGIAHEIKNPLNFVNNFSGVSAELIDELQEALKDVSLNEKRRIEITELMDTLRGNLDKVVQHGKRADAIVKNMLLHSREGSGEHRPVDINDLVEESLNLAYHGARAEKQGFTITLERALDPTVGEADVFPQDITRALLNLISNGFYAATKRRAETNGGDYEPTLSAATKNLGDRVEIRIRDNGTGIPPEAKEKIFNPFFTTKPAGEGTGLGLSISHDIIVKQHGGSIEVDTQPGVFTEIRVILPRAAVVP